MRDGSSRSGQTVARFHCEKPDIAKRICNSIHLWRGDMAICETFGLEQVKIWSHDYSEPSMPFIEPGEKDALEYEFFLPAEIETVKIYSYYMNENESPSRARCIPDYRTHAEVIGRGWTKTTLYDLR